MVARGEALRTPGWAAAGSTEPRRGEALSPLRGLIGCRAPPFQGFAKPHPWLPSVAPPGLQNSTYDNIE